MDQAYCDALFASQYAPHVAELILSHLWVNTAMPLCYQVLSAVVPEHFRTRRERAALWNLILLDGINRDLRLVPYLVLRGLASEASTALRRAFEHTGVLSSIISNLDSQRPARYALRLPRGEEGANADRATGLFRLDRHRGPRGHESGGAPCPRADEEGPPRPWDTDRHRRLAGHGPGARHVLSAVASGLEPPRLVQRRRDWSRAPPMGGHPRPPLALSSWG
jgi:hypothetical protein